MQDTQRIWIRRDTHGCSFGVALLARRLARQEAHALITLKDLPEIPRLQSWDGYYLDRSYIQGHMMQEARPFDNVAYFRHARRLLQRIHSKGVVHNDLAKEGNWLVSTSDMPALIDFQLALQGPPRARWLRLLAREDIRHLLKHKRTYCPKALTPVERRLLARPSWIRHLWFCTGKPLYRWITRRVLGWQDNEGKGMKPE